MQNNINVLFVQKEDSSKEKVILFNTKYVFISRHTNGDRSFYFSRPMNLVYVIHKDLKQNIFSRLNKMEI